ncbi:MAG: hypothetical protein ABII27_05170 [bacterium]
MKKKKKPYTKPEISSQVIFEKASLACGKCYPIGSGPIWRAQCIAIKRTS